MELKYNYLVKIKYTHKDQYGFQPQILI